MTTTLAIRSFAIGKLLWPKLKAMGNHFPDWFAPVAGGVLLFLGLANVLGSYSALQALTIPDPVLNVPFRRIMLAVGMLQLAVSFILLFTNRKSPGLGLTICVSANFLVYRIALWTMGWRYSSGFLFDPLGLSMRTTDAVMSLASAILLGGSCAVFWMERRTRLAIEFQKMFCPSCGGHVRFATQNLGRQINCPHCKAALTLRKAENLKMSCFFCKEHIEFPAHALGRKIQCPHCKMDITLQCQTPETTRDSRAAT